MTSKMIRHGGDRPRSTRGPGLRVQAGPLARRRPRVVTPRRSVVCGTSAPLTFRTLVPLTASAGCRGCLPHRRDAPRSEGGPSRRLSQVGLSAGSRATRVGFWLRSSVAPKGDRWPSSRTPAEMSTPALRSSVAPCGETGPGRTTGDVPLTWWMRSARCSRRGPKSVRHDDAVDDGGLCRCRPRDQAAGSTDRLQRQPPHLAVGCCGGVQADPAQRDASVVNIHRASGAGHSRARWRRRAPTILTRSSCGTPIRPSNLENVPWPDGQPLDGSLDSTLIGMSVRPGRSRSGRCPAAVHSIPQCPLSRRECGGVLVGTFDGGVDADTHHDRA